MTAKLLLALLLTTTLTATAAPDRPQPAEDPCELARRIAQSPACRAGSACEALDLWREAFGQPEVVPVGAGQLPTERASRLPDSRMTFANSERASAPKTLPGRPRQLGRYWPPTLNCRVR
ncbi:MAG TPA: hypothetical protein VNM67_12905 [Thermoanaerobaculia bacterium]|jgi:hypothetical protein|nr:hypothetical protein [Thermoanaerobaculia bacterium]